MSKEFDAAIEQYLDQVAAGKTRKFDAPITEVRDPEPTQHPDERMHMTIRDPALRLGKAR